MLHEENETLKLQLASIDTEIDEDMAELEATIERLEQEKATTTGYQERCLAELKTIVDDLIAYTEDLAERFMVAIEFQAENPRLIHDEVMAKHVKVKAELDHLNCQYDLYRWYR